MSILPEFFIGITKQQTKNGFKQSHQSDRRYRIQLVKRDDDAESPDNTKHTTTKKRHQPKCDSASKRRWSKNLKKKQQQNTQNMQHLCKRFILTAYEIVDRL